MTWLERLSRAGQMRRSYPAALRATGDHERRIFRQFGGRVAFDGSAPVTNRPLILVAFTNRSGSNLLCEYLRQSGKVAGGMEQLNHEVVAAQVAAHPVDRFADHIAGLLARQGRADQSFCLKASWDQLLMLYRWNIPAMFPQTRILHIQRHDAIAQAVSYSIALQTKRWNSIQPGNGQAPAFLPRQIGQILSDQRQANDHIALLAQILEVPRVAVSYEQIVAAPDAHLRRVLRFCGIALPDLTVRPPALQRQADPVNADFAARFRADWRAMLLPPPDKTP